MFTTFLGKPPLMVWVEKHLRHFICSLVILEWLCLDSIIMSLQGKERERERDVKSYSVVRTEGRKDEVRRGIRQRAKGQSYTKIQKPNLMGQRVPSSQSLRG